MRNACNRTKSVADIVGDGASGIANRQSTVRGGEHHARAGFNIVRLANGGGEIIDSKFDAFFRKWVVFGKTVPVGTRLD